MFISSRVKTIVLALINRGGGMVLQFASIWLIAKAVGVAGVGIYSFYTAWMTVLATLTGFGSTTLVVRTVSVLFKQGNFLAIRIYIKKMGILLLGSGIVLAIFIASAGREIIESFVSDSNIYQNVVYAAIGSIAFMLMRLMSEALKSLSLLNTSMLLESVFIPALLVILCVFSALNYFELTVELLIWTHIALMTFVAFVMFIFVWVKTKNSDIAPQSNTVNLSLFSKSMLPLWGSSLLGMLFLNMPLLMLPNFATSEEMGLFAIAYRFINICVTLLMVIGGIYGPRFAKEYADLDGVALMKSLKQTQLFSIAMYAPLFVCFMVIPDYVMGLFGSPFKQGGALLVAMALGQLVYASTGLVGTMMNMIHREYVEFWIMLFSTALMATLIFILGREMSILGVAIGFGLGLGLKNIASLVAVRRYLSLV